MLIMSYKKNYEKFFSELECCVDKLLCPSRPLIRDNVQSLMVVIVVDHWKDLDECWLLNLLYSRKSQLD